MKSLSFDTVKWRDRLLHSGFFLCALLFHLLLFLMFATWVIFKAPPGPEEAASFQQIAVPPPPPPAPPAKSGGEAANQFEPAQVTAPPPAAMSVMVTSNASTFSIKSVPVTIPSLPASMTHPVGSDMTGHNAPGLDLGAGSPFGSSAQGDSSQLTGYLYDLKQTSDRKPTDMNPGKFHNKIKEFIEANWSSRILDPYYKSSKALSTPSIFIPVIRASDGPKAFGVESEVQPNMYCVWYKVTASPSQDGTYHFVGVGDDILLVRVNGKTVLDGSDFTVNDEVRKKEKSMEMSNFKPTFEGNSHFWMGTPFHVSTHDQVDIEVLIGEEPGGASDYFLYIQREDSTYQCQSNNAPLLPVFQLDTKPIKPAGEPMSFPPFSTCLEPWVPVSK